MESRTSNSADMQTIMCIKLVNRYLPETLKYPEHKEIFNYFSKNEIQLDKSQSELLLHFLCNALDEKRFKSIIKWPIYDSKDSIAFRAGIIKFIGEVCKNIPGEEVPKVSQRLLLDPKSKNFKDLISKLSFLTLKKLRKTQGNSKISSSLRNEYGSAEHVLLHFKEKALGMTNFVRSLREKVDGLEREKEELDSVLKALGPLPKDLKAKIEISNQDLKPDEMVKDIEINDNEENDFLNVYETVTKLYSLSKDREGINADLINEPIPLDLEELVKEGEEVASNISSFMENYHEADFSSQTETLSKICFESQEISNKFEVMNSKVKRYINVVNEKIAQTEIVYNAIELKDEKFEPSPHLFLQQNLLFNTPLRNMIKREALNINLSPMEERVQVLEKIPCKSNSTNKKDLDKTGLPLEQSSLHVEQVLGRLPNKNAIKNKSLNISVSTYGGSPLHTKQQYSVCSLRREFDLTHSPPLAESTLWDRQNDVEFVSIPSTNEKTEENELDDTWTLEGDDDWNLNLFESKRQSLDNLLERYKSIKEKM